MSHWLPLESNPDVLNKFIAGLGVDTSKHSFFDIYGTDPELLQMVTSPLRILLASLSIGNDLNRFLYSKIEAVASEMNIFSMYKPC